MSTCILSPHLFFFSSLSLSRLLFAFENIGFSNHYQHHRHQSNVIKCVCKQPFTVEAFRSSRTAHSQQKYVGTYAFSRKLNEFTYSVVGWIYYKGLTKRPISRNMGAYMPHQQQHHKLSK